MYNMFPRSQVRKGRDGEAGMPTCVSLPSLLSMLPLQHKLDTEAPRLTVQSRAWQLLAQEHQKEPWRLLPLPY